MKIILLELLMVGLISIVLGATANQVRARNALKWNESYFRAPVSTPAGTEAPEDDAEEKYQTISLDEIVDIVGDPDTPDGLYVFVDARNETAYEEGHIEGAVRCYHYDLELCIENLVELALGAEKIIVYCNGGECTDSKYMSSKLVNEYSIPYEAVYLFVGGYKEWIDNEMPYVEGLDP